MATSDRRVVNIVFMIRCICYKSRLYSFITLHFREICICIPPSELLVLISSCPSSEMHLQLSHISRLTSQVFLLPIRHIPFTLTPLSLKLRVEVELYIRVILPLHLEKPL